MNNLLLIRTLRKIIKIKSVSLCSIAAIDNSSYTDAFDVMRYLLEKDVIKESRDGMFTVTKDNEYIEQLRRELGDWKKEFTNVELKNILSSIDLQAFFIIRILGGVEGKTMKEIRIDTKDTEIDVDTTLSVLQAKCLVAYDKGKYYGVISEDDYNKMTDIYKNDKREQKRMVDAENKRLNELEKARKATAAKKENKSSAGKKESRETESDDAPRLSEDYEDDEIAAQIDEMRKEFDRKNNADIVLILNGGETKVRAKADLSDNPIVLLKKFVLRHDAREIAGLFGGTRFVRMFKRDVSSLDKEGSTFEIELDREIVELDWDLPINEQINAEQTRKIANEGKLFSYAAIIMRET